MPDATMNKNTLPDRQQHLLKYPKLHFDNKKERNHSNGANSDENKMLQESRTSTTVPRTLLLMIADGVPELLYLLDPLRTFELLIILNVYSK